MSKKWFKCIIFSFLLGLILTTATFFHINSKFLGFVCNEHGIECQQGSTYRYGHGFPLQYYVDLPDECRDLDTIGTPLRSNFVTSYFIFDVLIYGAISLVAILLIIRLRKKAKI